MKSTSEDRLEEVFQELFSKYTFLAFEEQEAVKEGDNEKLENLSARRILLRRILVLFSQHRAQLQTLLDELDFCSFRKLEE